MRFLKWLANNQDEEPQNSQLDLFSGSQDLAKHERVDGSVVNKDLNRTIQKKGGSGRVYAESAEAMTNELFDVGTEELYDATGGTKNRRNTLPKAAQKAFIMGESVADFDLREKEIEGKPHQKNEQIVDSVKQSGEKVRKLFPW